MLIAEMIEFDADVNRIAYYDPVEITEDDLIEIEGAHVAFEYVARIVERLFGRKITYRDIEDGVIFDITVYDEDGLMHKYNFRSW